MPTCVNNEGSSLMAPAPKRMVVGKENVAAGLIGVSGITRGARRRLQ
jgi:hypothetical protein